MVGFAALPQHPSLLDGVAAPASPDDGTAAGTGERKRRRRKRDVQVYPRARRRRCRRAPRGDRHGCAGPPPRRLWSSVVQQAKNAIAETQRVRTLLDVARNPSVLDTGQKIVASLEARLESFGYRRSLQQREFHDAFIRACLPHIYGLDYFDRHKRRILKRHGLKRMRSEVLCLTPRRFGKTTAVAMFAAAALLEIPDIVLAIFSTGSRASGGLMQQIVGLLSNHARDEFQARKLKQNNEQLFLSSAADSALGGGKGRAVGASLYSFPASGDTLRGVSPKVCILEEASHIDSSIFNTVIVPLLGVKYTAVLAISTPDTEFNYYSALLEMKDPETGDTLFKTIRFELVCDRCKNSGDAVSCTHMDHKLPRWKSSKTQAKMAAILADDPELNARENKGIIITNTRFIFNAKMVRALLEAPRLPLAQGAATRPLSVTMCVDPSGGGSGSDYAVCSTMVLQDGSIVICGLDSTPSSDPGKIDAMIISHVDGLRRRVLAYAPHVQIDVYVEANSSFVTAHEVAMLVSQRQFQPLLVARFDPHKYNRFGVWTTHIEKELFALKTRDALRRGTLRVASDLVCSTRAEKAQIVSDLGKQLERYRAIPPKPESAAADRPGGTVMRLTGKSGKSKDDLVICLGMCLHWPDARPQ